MRVLYGILFIMVAMPAVLMLAYDINNYNINPSDGFKLHKTEYFWENFDPDTYNQARKEMSEENWSKLKKILDEKGVYVAGVFALLFYALVAIGKKMFGKEEPEEENDRLAFLREDNKGKNAGYKYKRAR